MTKYITTFKALRNAGACTTRYRYLAKALGGIRNYGEDTPIPLTKILETNGIDDAVWALCTLPEADRSRVRLFTCACVRRTPLAGGGTVWDLLADERSRHAVEVAEKYAKGEVIADELAAARDAARDAADAAQAEIFLDILEKSNEPYPL